MRYALEYAINCTIIWLNTWISYNEYTFTIQA